MIKWSPLLHPSINIWRLMINLNRRGSNGLLDSLFILNRAEKKVLEVMAVFHQHSLLLILFLPLEFHQFYNNLWSLKRKLNMLASCYCPCSFSLRVMVILITWINSQLKWPYKNTILLNSKVLWTAITRILKDLTLLKTIKNMDQEPKDYGKKDLIDLWKALTQEYY